MTRADETTLAEGVVRVNQASQFSIARDQEWQAELRKVLADVEKYRDQAATQFERANAATDACTALSQDNAKLTAQVKDLEESVEFYGNESDFHHAERVKLGAEVDRLRPVVEAAIACIKAERASRAYMEGPRFLNSNLKQHHLKALRDTSEVLRIAVDAYEQSLLTSKEGIE